MVKCRKNDGIKEIVNNYGLNHWKNACEKKSNPTYIKMENVFHMGLI